MAESKHHHENTRHTYKGGDVPHDHAFGKNGYVLEGLQDAIRGFGRLLILIVVIIIAFFLIRWAVTEYYITTHCTTVLGTRVCQ